ncbi:MAG: hypothetical protein ABI318_07200 [Chthoniobacteraceae bacterium]
MRIFPTLLLVVSTAAAASRLMADPAAEITSFSVFKEVDMKKLAKGDVIAASGPTMKFSRGLEVESLFILPLPVAKANDAQQKWDEMRHPELKVYQHVDLPRHPSAQDFQRIASAPHNFSVSKFVTATEKLNPERPDLQMSAAEAKGAGRFEAGAKGAMPPSVAAFWSGLLHARTNAFLASGLAGQPAYFGRGGSVRPADETAELLRERPAIRRQFSALAATMTGGAGGNPALFYELFDVEGRAALSLGATYTRSAGESIQSGTVQFYSSDGFYVLLSISQMWPVQIDGKTSTLVWRTDLLSSSQLGELRGIERSGSAVAMRKEIQKNIQAMVKDISSQR